MKNETVRSEASFLAVFYYVNITLYVHKPQFLHEMRSTQTQNSLLLPVICYYRSKNAAVPETEVHRNFIGGSGKFSLNLIESPYQFERWFGHCVTSKRQMVT